MIETKPTTPIPMGAKLHMDLNTKLIDAWLAQPGVVKSAPIHPSFIAGFDAAWKSMRGVDVSVDVSTGDADAGHRIFAKVDVVQDGVLLAIEEKRNF